MPYTSIEDLPDPVKNHLPKHAQEIFKDAFNSAYAAHHENEITAFKIAWSAVKRKYAKRKDEWEQKAS